MIIELRVMQFWSEIIPADSFDFEITHMISHQIALHSVQQLPLLIVKIKISSIVIGLKNSYFSLVHLPSCYRTV